MRTIANQTGCTAIVLCVKRSSLNETMFKIYRDAACGDKYCNLYVLTFGLWLLGRFSPPSAIVAGSNDAG